MFRVAPALLVDWSVEQRLVARQASGRSIGRQGAR